MVTEWATPTWHSGGGTHAAFLVVARDVALQAPGARLGKLGHVTKEVVHRLEDHVRVVLPKRWVGPTQCIKIIRKRYMEGCVSRTLTEPSCQDLPPPFSCS